MRWNLALLAIGAAALAGCGGGGGLSLNPGSTPVGPPTDTRDEMGTARFDVNVETGKVTITPLGNASRVPAGRAIYTGSSVTFETSDLVVDNAGVSRRRLSLRVRNNSGEPIGDHNGLRLIVSRLQSGGTGVDRRNLVTVRTVAGTGAAGSTDGFGTSATTTPQGLAMLRDGSLAVVESTRMRLYRNGNLTTMRGGLTNAVSAVIISDPISRAEFAIVGDQGAHLIRMVEMSTGITSIFAGTGVAGDAIGAANVSQFNEPMGVAWDPSRSAIFVADRTNGKVKRIAVTFAGGRPVAGAVTSPYSGLTNPTGVAVSRSGTIAVCESTANRVRLFIQGTIGIAMGSGVAGTGTGDGVTGQFNTPTAVAYSDDVLLVSNSGSGIISTVELASDSAIAQPRSYSINLLAGSGLGFADANGNQALFGANITGLVATQGRTFVADRANARLRAVEYEGAIFTPGPLGGGEGRVEMTNQDGLLNAQSGLYGGDPYRALPNSVQPSQTLDLGTLDFELDNGVRRFSFVVTLEAGTSGVANPDAILTSGLAPGSPNTWVQPLIYQSPLSVDGPVGSASYRTLVDVAVDGSGSIFVAESDCIRRIDIKTQTVSTIAGVSGQNTYLDSFGSSARFSDIRRMAVTQDGNTIYVVTGSHTARAIQYVGYGPREHPDSYQTTTVMGAVGQSGYVGGTGNQMRFAHPRNIAVKSDGLRIAILDDSGFIRIVRFTGTSRLDPSNYSTDFDHGNPLGGTPREIDFDPLGGIAIASVDGNNNYTLLRLSETNWTYADLIRPSEEMDQDGAHARASSVEGMASSPTGEVWFVSRGRKTDSIYRVRRISRHGLARTVAGGGSVITGSATGDRISIQPNMQGFVGAVAPNGDFLLLNGFSLARISRIVRN